MKNNWEWSSFFLYLCVFLFPIFVFSLKKTGNGLYKDKYKTISNFKIILAFLPAYLLQALRSEFIGSDLQNYFRRYMNMKNIDFSQMFESDSLLSQEPVFIFFQKITGEIFNWNFFGFIFMSSTIIFLMYFLTFKKYKTYGINLSIAMLTSFCILYVRSFSMVRQSISLAISLYSLTFLEEKKYKTFWLLTLLAFGFHYTAVINIIFYFWSKKDSLIMYKRIGILVILLGVIFAGDKLFYNILGFVETAYDLEHFTENSLGVGNFLIRIPLLILLSVMRKSLISENPKAKFYLNLYYLDIMISQLKYLNVRFERLTMYTMLPLIFILPIFYNLLRKKFGYAVSSIMYIVLIIVYIYNVYNFSIVKLYNLMPYEFIWQ